MAKNYLHIGILVLMMATLLAMIACSSSDSTTPAQPAPAAPAAPAAAADAAAPAAPAQPAAAAPAAPAAAPVAPAPGTTKQKVTAKPKAAVAKTTHQFAEGKRGGVMKIITGKWFQRWDMTTRSHWSSTQGLNRFYSGVLQFSPRDGITVTPDLANGWELSDDLLGSTFTFNEGVKWHDGQPFTLDDVVYTINRWQNPPEGMPQPRIAGLLLVKDMQIVDSTTLKMTHTKPTSRILTALADSWHPVLPKHVLEPAGGVLDSPEQVIGTGAYKITDWEDGSSVTSEANPDYFINAPDGKPLPYLDGIIGIAFAGADLAQAALATRQVDYYTSLTPTLGLEAAKSNPDLLVTRWDSPGFQGISMNANVPPFDDAELRAAFRCGLDTREIADLSSAPGIEPPTMKQISFFGTADPNYDDVLDYPCIAASQREAQEAKSREVFKAKGFTDVKFHSDDPDNPIATIVQQQMKALGVDVEIVVEEMMSARETAYAGDTTLFWFGQAVASKSPVEIINQIFRPGSGFELYQATPPKTWLDALDQLDMATLGSPEEKVISKEMDRIMREEWVPKVPVRRPDEFQVKQNSVMNVDAIATAKFIQSRFVDAWLDR